MAKKTDSSLASILSTYGVSKPLEFVDTGVSALNTVLGGGIALGYFYTFWGVQGCGKSTITCQVVRAFCRQGLKVVYIDSERALNSRQKDSFGLSDFEAQGLFIHLSVQFMDQLEEVGAALSQDPSIKLVVIDSLSEIQPYADKELRLQDIRPGLKAQQSSLLLPRLKHWFANAGIACIVLLHARANVQMGVVNPYAPKEKSDGGYATQHVPDVVLKISIGAKLKEKDPVSGDDIVIGATTKLEAEKNKFTAPFHPLTCKLLYGKGISQRYEIIDTALERGVIQKTGNTYILPSGEKFVGIGKLYGMPRESLSGLKDYLNGGMSQEESSVLSASSLEASGLQSTEFDIQGSSVPAIESED